MNKILVVKLVNKILRYIFILNWQLRDTGRIQMKVTSFIQTCRLSYNVNKERAMCNLRYMLAFVVLSSLFYLIETHKQTKTTFIPLINVPRWCNGRKRNWQQKALSSIPVTCSAFRFFHLEFFSSRQEGCFCDWFIAISSSPITCDMRVYCVM